MIDPGSTESSDGQMLDIEDGWQSSLLTCQEDFAMIEVAYKGMHHLAGQDNVEATPDMLPPHMHPEFKEMTLAARFDCVKTMVEKLVTQEMGGARWDKTLGIFTKPWH